MTDPITEAIEQAAEAGARRALAGHLPKLTLSRSEVASMLGVSTTTVDRMTGAGDLVQVVAGRITLASVLDPVGGPPVGGPGMSYIAKPGSMVAHIRVCQHCARAARRQALYLLRDAAGDRP